MPDVNGNNQKISQLIGRYQPHIKLTEKIKTQISSNQLQHITAELFLEAFENNLELTAELQHFIQKKVIYAIGFSKRNSLFGCAYFFFNQPMDRELIDVLETFVHLASVVLQRREIEAELKESENKFRLLADMAPIAIFIHRCRQIIYANKEAETYTGYSAEELKQKNFYEIFALEIQNELLEKARICLENRQDPAPEELKFKKKDGAVLWAGIASRVFDFAGEPAIMMTLIDITASKLALEKEKKHQEQLMQADKMISLGTLVSGVAHEINNPNNIIMVNTPVLRDIWNNLRPIVDQYYHKVGDFEVGGLSYQDVPEAAADLFEGISESSKKIRSIVEDLKNFARPNLFDLNQDVDINKVLKSSVSLLTNMIVKATRKFSIAYDEFLPLIRGNFQRLEQVIINLLQNACQALEHNQQGIYVNSLYDEHKHLIFVTVKDEGRGIDPENMKFLLDPFFTTKRDSGGTGLGLSISSWILKEHGGRLEIESKKGSYSLFRIVLPVQASKQGGTDNA
jgi:PAS domain S-box-containing protein